MGGCRRRSGAALRAEWRGENAYLLSFCPSCEKSRRTSKSSPLLASDRRERLFDDAPVGAVLLAHALFG